MAGYEQDLKNLVAQLNRGQAGGPEAGPAPDLARTQAPVVEWGGVDGSAGSPGLDPILAQAASVGASDLLLLAGAPVAMRIHGKLTLVGDTALEAGDVRGLLQPLLSTRQQQELQRQRSVDFCFERQGIGRFRANLHFQRGTLAGSLRLLPAKIPTLESLHLPAALRRLAEVRQGLVLVTGATGSGKSSTLAALIHLINSERRDHIVTIEDPVEYAHGNLKSIVEQIEVGQDTPDFASSLRSIVRQNPDVILVGEMRDAETIGTVLSAAETGHLVLSTLHTNDTSQAVSRILDSFPQGNQPQIRQQFSLAMVAIVAQQLVPAKDGRGRLPAVELMTASNATRNLIRKGDDHQLYSALSTGRADGMVTMEQSLAEMVRAGQITRETAMAHCYRPDELPRYLK
jgi:twitching motility protein PilT